VLDVAVGRVFAWWSAAVILVVLVGLWFVLPLPVRTRNDRGGPDGDGPDGDGPDGDGPDGDGPDGDDEE